ncbi:MAG: sigma-70 family RNA polymerase sigma factor [Candidatus Tectomicrobia bacterium]|nr:sigma-70 family RNA polymerase sigma factor [Candidatus Tectomicrobia bacterium]
MGRAEFEQAVLESLESLYNISFWMTRNKVEAEDLVQETCLRALKFRQQFKEGTNLKAWLFTIMKNTLINHREKSAREVLWNSQRNDEVTADLPRAQGNEISLQEELALFRTLARVDIDSALMKLSDELRMTVLLADVEEFTLEEIAEIMSCPLGTVKSRLHRAREMLRSMIRDYTPSSGKTLEPGGHA